MVDFQDSIPLLGEMNATESSPHQASSTTTWSLDRVPDRCGSATYHGTALRGDAFTSASDALLGCAHGQLTYIRHVSCASVCTCGQRVGLHMCDLYMHTASAALHVNGKFIGTSLRQSPVTVSLSCLGGLSCRFSCLSRQPPRATFREGKVTGLVGPIVLCSLWNLDVVGIPPVPFSRPFLGTVSRVYEGRFAAVACLCSRCGLCLST